jgi:hypothetical protein
MKHDFVGTSIKVIPFARNLVGGMLIENECIKTTEYQEQERACYC